MGQHLPGQAAAARQQRRIAWPHKADVNWDIPTHARPLHPNQTLKPERM